MQVRVRPNGSTALQRPSLRSRAKNAKILPPFNLKRAAQEASNTECNRVGSYTEEETPSVGQETVLIKMPAHVVDPIYRVQELQYMVENCLSIQLSRRVDASSVSSCGYYGGCRDESMDRYPKKVLPLGTLSDKYLRLGYTYIRWDGITARPLLDWDGRVFAVLAGRPTDPSYMQACEEALDAINEEGKRAQFNQDHLHHKRGRFPAVNVGVSHGIGTTRPVNLQNDKLNAAMHRLLLNPGMQRISAFQNAAFELWAPKLYSYYDLKLSKIWANDPNLAPGFANSVWLCTAINFGPKVFTTPHKDCKNLSFGWCSIASLGSFDSRKGGHLVLPDLRLIIEFPSGSNIFIPSALLTHCNTPVQADEARVSFTQFCAGELFRYSDCGLRTEAELKRTNATEHAAIVKQKRTRWEDGINLYQVMKKHSVC